MEDTVGKLFGSWLPETPTALAGLGASGPGCPRRDHWKTAMEDYEQSETTEELRQSNP